MHGFLRAQNDPQAFADVIETDLYGVFYGFAVGESLYARDGAEIALADLKVRKQRRFGFSPEGELKLLTSSNPLGEVAMAAGAPVAVDAMLDAIDQRLAQLAMPFKYAA